MATGRAGSVGLGPIRAGLGSQFAGKAPAMVIWLQSYFGAVVKPVPTPASGPAVTVLLGSDFPFDMGPDDPVADVEAVATLNDEQRRAILGETAAQLLGVARG